nr:phenylalanine--tRNA ligase alpha subunit, cytoplasmic [Ipomoea batatas]
MNLGAMDLEDSACLDMGYDWKEIEANKKSIADTYYLLFQSRNLYKLAQYHEGFKEIGWKVWKFGMLRPEMLLPHGTSGRVRVIVGGLISCEANHDTFMEMTIVENVFGHKVGSCLIKKSYCRLWTSTKWALLSFLCSFVLVRVDRSTGYTTFSDSLPISSYTYLQVFLDLCLD